MLSPLFNPTVAMPVLTRPHVRNFMDSLNGTRPLFVKNIR
jgi:hypothetical protein